MTKTIPRVGQRYYCPARCSFLRILAVQTGRVVYQDLSTTRTHVSTPEEFRRLAVPVGMG